MITGFQAKCEVDDGGTGAAAGSTSTVFANLLTLMIPKRTAGAFDATELNQLDGSSAVDPVEREEPTGTIKVGDTQAEIKYTKAHHTRLNALLGQRGYTWKISAPDDLSAGTATILTCSFVGFVSEIGEVKFEKGKPVSIPFVLTVSRKPTYA